MWLRLREKEGKKKLWEPKNKEEEEALLKVCQVAKEERLTLSDDIEKGGPTSVA